MIASRAILIRRAKFSETSLLVHWFTETAGRVKTLAKGARRPGSPLAGQLDLFYESEIAVARSRRTDLHTLREAVLIDPREPLRRDPLPVAAAAYFVELLELATEPEYPLPEVFALLRRALDYLATQPPTAVAVTHFERELARLLGLGVGPGTPAHHALGRTCGRLPGDRAALLAALDAGRGDGR